jgi:hypothetical protein
VKEERMDFDYDKRNISMMICDTTIVHIPYSNIQHSLFKIITLECLKDIHNASSRRKYMPVMTIFFLNTLHITMN